MSVSLTQISSALIKLSRIKCRAAQGDQQVPEGIYAITGFNPKSALHKTLQLNYPNAFDRSKGATGGGIGIHGKCASVGCIGMRNDQMDSIEKALK
jgi:murein L,D-transpeptidase YafK